MEPLVGWLDAGRLQRVRAHRWGPEEARSARLEP